MSLSSFPSTVRAVAASALALAVLSTAASSAHAAVVPPATLQYDCKYPLVDKKPLTIDITSNIPTHAKYDTLQPKFEVNAVATAGGGTAEAIDTLDAQFIEGVSEARASLVYQGTGFEQKNLKVPLTVDRWTKPTDFKITDDLVLNAKGSTPAVTLDELGKVDIRVDSIALNLKALYADGSPIDVKKLKTNYDGVAVNDSDGDPFTFDVYCKLKPNTSNIIATICVNETGIDDGWWCGGGCGSIAARGASAEAYTPALSCPPTQVTGLKLDAVDATSATISWTPAVDLNGDPVKYDVFRGETRVAIGLSATSFKDTGLTASTAYSYTVARTGGASPASTALSVTTAPLDIAAPGKPGPGEYVEGDTGEDFLIVRWTPSTDAGGPSLKGYEIEFETEDGSGTIQVPATATSYKFTGLGAGSDYTYAIRAVDNAGNQSEALIVSRSTLAPDEPPTAPTGLKLDSTTPSSVRLSWTAATDDVGVSGYDVYRDGQKITATPVTGLTFADSSVSEATSYVYAVEAIDTAGKRSPKSAALNVQVPHNDACPVGGVCNYDYALKGKSAIKTFVTGNLPLAGGMKAQLKTDGTFTADLTLAVTSGRVVGAGFLPVIARIGFVPFSKTTGVVRPATATQPGSIETNSKVRIKVVDLKLFSFIPLVIGNTCQTKQLTDINLKSTNAFDPTKGGSVAGTFKISDLNGCAGLDGLVSPLIAGRGNTIALDLVRKG